MSSQDVLFIVEGEKVEPNLLSKINQILHLQENINIFSYCTSIYELYEGLVLDQDLDVALLLREKTNDKRIKATLSKTFAAIYLLLSY